jgi:hypothetical protein
MRKQDRPLVRRSRLSLTKLSPKVYDSTFSEIL